VLERRRLPGGVAALVSPILEADGYLVAFTERTGGSSSGPFASMNLGLRVGDEGGLVVQNRRTVCRSLGIAPFACGEQVHGAGHAWVGPDRAGAGFADVPGAILGVDALFTDSSTVPVAMLTADCVPLALVDPSAGTVAVVHAGWRGIAAGIVPAVLERFEEPSAIRAAVGPAIGVDHYEVGDDVARAVSAATPGGAPSRKEGSRLFLDLPGAVEATLRSAGVRSIERAEECTACEPERFFSYRRDGVTGRQALVAAIMG
jgi:YfiH family protein